MEIHVKRMMKVEMNGKELTIHMVKMDGKVMREVETIAVRK